MPDLNKPLRTETDFNIAFTALLTSARRFGVVINDECNRAFIQHVAEVMAEDHAQIRRLYNVINKPLVE